ncbi:hypothetical protein GCM10009582_14630 [Arthrobacter flavus]
MHFDVGGDDFYIDLLFFHVEQLRYFVIEFKTGEFQPEYAGKLNFYVVLVDDKRKLPAHRETVGILICGSKNEHTVRYALGRTDSLMAVSTYTYESLPAAEKIHSPVPRTSPRRSTRSTWPQAQQNKKQTGTKSETKSSACPHSPASH